MKEVELEILGQSIFQLGINRKWFVLEGIGVRSDYIDWSNSQTPFQIIINPKRLKLYTSRYRKFTLLTWIREWIYNRCPQYKGSGVELYFQEKFNEDNIMSPYSITL